MTHLHFPSEKAAQERLRRLAKHRLVVRVDVPVRRQSQGRSVWALGARGARRLRACTELTPKHLSPGEERSALFADHTLARNRVRVALELLARQGELELLDWRQETPQVKSRVALRQPGKRRRLVSVVPDGFFLIRHQDRSQAFVLEVDMGTVAASRMQRRYQAYFAWWKAGLHRKRFGPEPLRVLTVVNSQRRLKRLHELASEAPGSGKTRLFWFLNLEQVNLERPGDLLRARAAVSSRELDAPDALFGPSQPPERS